MSLAFLHPLALWGLSALAVPVLIHLTRRTEQRVTPFAALRWLSAAFPPRRRIRLSEWWLLLLRLLLIAAIVLWWAQPVLKNAVAPKGTWVMVSPGVDPARARAQFNEPAQWRWLAPGFPELTALAPPREVPTASLLREIDAKLADDARLIAFVPERVTGLDGERIELRHAIDWRVVESAPAFATGNDQKPAALHVALRYNDPESSTLRYVRAAIKAWQAVETERYPLDDAAQGTALPDDTRWLILSGDEFDPAQQAWIEQGGIALTDHADADAPAVWRDDTGRVLATASRQGKGRVVHLQVALTPTDLPALLDADFPARLLALMQGDAPAPTGASAAAAKPGQDPKLFARSIDKPLGTALLIAIALLLALERLIASGDRGRTA